MTRIDNKNITKIVLQDVEQQIAQGKFTPKLNKVEGIITSKMELKGKATNNPYYLAFFQLEGIDQDIPVIFKLDSSVD